jgi:hypothetical protein
VGGEPFAVPASIPHTHGLWLIVRPAEAYPEGGYEPTDANIQPESEAIVKKAIEVLLGVE